MGGHAPEAVHYYRTDCVGQLTAYHAGLHSYQEASEALSDCIAAMERGNMAVAVSGVCTYVWMTTTDRSGYSTLPPSPFHPPPPPSTLPPPLRGVGECEGHM